MAGRLHVAEVTAEGATPARRMLLLHGILGSGANLRTLAKRLAAAAPDWGFVLVDLRMHGLSQGFAPPHTVAAAARDLFALEVDPSTPIAGVLGHSFGGKVALAYAESRRASLEHVVLLDANPGARDAARLGASQMIEMLATLPDTFASREEFVECVRARGVGDRAEAEWLATNLRRDGEVFRWRLDLEAMRQMIDDYAARDLWPVVEAGGASPTFDLIIGGASDAFTAEDRARALEAAEKNGAVRAIVVDGARHWVHVDALDSVVEATLAALGSRGEGRVATKGGGR